MVSICNLVEEFNGLVSTEGSAFAGPLVFLTVNSERLTVNQLRRMSLKQTITVLSSLHSFKSLLLSLHEQN